MDLQDINEKINKLEDKNEKFEENLSYNWDRRSNDNKNEFKDYKLQFDNEIQVIDKKIDILRLQGIASWVLMLTFLISSLQYTMKHIETNVSISEELIKKVVIDHVEISHLVKSMDQLNKNLVEIYKTKK